MLWQYIYIVDSYSERFISITCNRLYSSYLNSDQSFIASVFLSSHISVQVCGKAGGPLEINRDEQSATPADLNLNPL